MLTEEDLDTPMDYESLAERGTMLGSAGVVVMDSGTWTFLHIPTRDEVARMVMEAGMVVVEDSMRSELCTDTPAAREFSSECRMWVVQRTR